MKAVLASVFLLTSFMGVPSHIANPYDSLRDQFEYCRSVHYGYHPEEIVIVDWRKCMDH